MAAVGTFQTKLGYKAPEFSLFNPLKNSNTTVEEVRGKKGTVVIFMCNHCPFVVHIIDQLVQIANEFGTKEIGFVAINSNDVINYPSDHPDKMLAFINQHNINFPYLFDEDQSVAKLYKASCTPDISVFDNNLECIYRGQFDDSRPSLSLPVTGNDLIQVCQALVNNDHMPVVQKASIGCNIKWIGEVPNYEL